MLRLQRFLAAVCITCACCGSVPRSGSLAHVVVEGGSLSATTSDHYLCWNIDASRNREFFDRDLSIARPFGAQLARQAKVLGQQQLGGRSILRFGGTGNDYLTYEFDTACPPAGNPIKECLNQTWWSNLLDFARASDAVIIFGVSLNTDHDMGNGGDKRWDPTNARHILRWTIDHGYGDLIYGFELGNEQDKEYTGRESALDLQILHNLTLELWPDARRRPVLLGPDAHGLHPEKQMPWDAPVAVGPKNNQLLTYIQDFAQACGELGIPLHGATLHEYIEVGSDSFLNGTLLDYTRILQTEFKRAVNAGWKASMSSASAPRVWGGEVGPHNGASPPCDHSSMRWANFGAAIWYIDALSQSAQVGYEAFCRQDLIGADYGMCDCSTGAPLPSYWAAWLWTRFMGQGVLATRNTATGDSTVRVYAHCTAETGAPSGAVTVIVINLRQEVVQVEIKYEGLSDSSLDRKEYHFTAVDTQGGLTNQTGLLGTQARLNGRLLRLDVDGAAPDLASFGKAGHAAHPVFMEPRSMAFVVLPEGNAQACGGQNARLIHV